MPESGSVERDYAVLLRRQIKQAAGLKVFDHAPVAVQQDQRGSCPPLDVVEAHTLHRNESPDRRVTTLSFLCKPPV